MTVKVGIKEGEEINVFFHGKYSSDDYSGVVEGSLKFHPSDFNGDIVFTPLEYHDSYFDLTDVTIGISFHWERRETQSFQGSLLLRSDGTTITAINILPVEDYLQSVVSSEMKATAPLEFLKAHAIISRSWLIAQIKGIADSGGKDMTDNEEERIRWYDHHQHIGFDVCADDHCQRYQGISRIVNERAKEAVESTAGLILTYDGEICDTRFSKCCGGAFEEFSSCWGNRNYPYLKAGRDSTEDAVIKDLTEEGNARKWIEGEPEAFCNTKDIALLQESLNGYDQETDDFYRWKVEYSNPELSSILRERTGIDFGYIRDIIPMERGVSGRLIKIRVCGSKRSLVIGKELEIRKCLSRSHLYSSAFVVDKTVSKGYGTEGKLYPDRFIIRGAGWGHGVGLCQIGAAVMASKGFDHREILSHYYPGATLQSITRK